MRTGSFAVQRWTIRRAALLACVSIVLLMGIAATTRAVLDLDLWRHNSQRARDLLGARNATAQQHSNAITALQLECLATFDALRIAAEQPGERGDMARAALENLRQRLPQ